jgi:hypothetical protein
LNKKRHWLNGLKVLELIYDKAEALEDNEIKKKT